MQVRLPGSGVPLAVAGSPQPIGSKSKRRPGPRVTMRNADYVHRIHTVSGGSSGSGGRGSARTVGLTVGTKGRPSVRPEEAAEELD
eukprot:1792390-Alexandrium_andersonii.AAC.1